MCPKYRYKYKYININYKRVFCSKHVSWVSLWKIHRLTESEWEKWRKKGSLLVAAAGADWEIALQIVKFLVSAPLSSEAHPYGSKQTGTSTMEDIQSAQINSSPVPIPYHHHCSYLTPLPLTPPSLSNSTITFLHFPEPPNLTTSLLVSPQFLLFPW